MNRTTHHVEPDGHTYIDPDNDSVLDSYGWIWYRADSPDFPYINGVYLVYLNGSVGSSYSDGVHDSYGKIRSPFINDYDNYGTCCVRSSGDINYYDYVYNSYGYYSPVTIMNRAAHHVEPDRHVYIDPDNDSVLDSYGVNLLSGLRWKWWKILRIKNRVG